MQPPSPENSRPRVSVLGAPIDAVGWAEALERVAQWAARRQSRYLCFCNVHSVVTARDDAGFARAIEGADLALPDGMPIAWMLRLNGFPGQQRVNGPDFMWQCCGVAEQRGIAVYFYGSTPATLAALRHRLAVEFPRLVIVGMESPPFRALTSSEETATLSRIDDSDAGLVFVGLGCPKQELWSAAARGRVRAVLAGVGAAFDYHAGTLPRAPRWMQRHGLEWLYRLAAEPGRLWRRYLVTNTRFLAGAAIQLLGRRGAAVRLLRREPR